MYSEKVMDHFQNPRNVGEIEDASGVGTVGNAKCGDIMRMFLDIDENGIIREAKFKTQSPTTPFYDSGYFAASSDILSRFSNILFHRIGRHRHC